MSDNQSYLNTLKDFKVLCLAWEQFFNLGVLDLFTKHQGRITAFHHSYNDPFDELSVEFPNNPEEVSQLFRSLMKDRDPGNLPFRRTSLFDSRAWWNLPLSEFVPWSGPDRSPNIKIALTDVPWQITSDCFTLYHRIGKYGHERLAELYFNHPDADPAYGRSARRGIQVAEAKFELEAKRPEMHATLLATVRAQCEKHNVRIVDLDVVDRLNGETFESFVEPGGRFHCKCGAQHSRGPINGANAYRCLACGETSVLKTNWTGGITCAKCNGIVRGGDVITGTNFCTCPRP